MLPVPLTIASIILLLAVLVSKLQYHSTYIIIAMYAFLGVLQTAGLIIGLVDYLEVSQKVEMIKIMLMAVVGLTYTVNLIGFVIVTPFLMSDRRFFKWINRKQKDGGTRFNLIWFHLINILSFLTNFKLKMLIFSRLFDLDCCKCLLDNTNKFRVFNVLSFIGLLPEVIFLYCSFITMRSSDSNSTLSMVMLDASIVYILNIVLSMLSSSKDKDFFKDEMDGLPINKVFNLAEESFESTGVIVNSQIRNKSFALEDILQCDELGYKTTKREVEARGKAVKARKQLQREEQKHYFQNISDQNTCSVMESNHDQQNAQENGRKGHPIQVSAKNVIQIQNEIVPNIFSQERNANDELYQVDSGQKQESEPMDQNGSVKEEENVCQIMVIDQSFDQSNCCGVSHLNKEEEERRYFAPMKADQLPNMTKIKQQTNNNDILEQQSGKTGKHIIYYNQRQHFPIDKYTFTPHQQPKQQFVQDDRVLPSAIQQYPPSQQEQINQQLQKVTPLAPPQSINNKIMQQTMIHQQRYKLLINENELMDSQPSQGIKTQTSRISRMMRVANAADQVAELFHRQMIVDTNWNGQSHRIKELDGVETEGSFAMQKYNGFTPYQNHCEEPIRNKNRETLRKSLNHPIKGNNYQHPLQISRNHIQPECQAQDGQIYQKTQKTIRNIPKSAIARTTHINTQIDQINKQKTDPSELPYHLQQKQEQQYIQAEQPNQKQTQSQSKSFIRSRHNQALFPYHPTHTSQPIHQPTVDSIPRQPVQLICNPKHKLTDFLKQRSKSSINSMLPLGIRRTVRQGPHQISKTSSSLKRTRNSSMDNNLSSDQSKHMSALQKIYLQRLTKSPSK